MVNFASQRNEESEHEIWCGNEHVVCATMGNRGSIESSQPTIPNEPHRKMGNTQSHRTPVTQFRVLVIGRANAGKTSILQRVCETTESPTIYRGNEEVRNMVQAFFYKSDSYCRQVTLNPTMDVSNTGDSHWLSLT